MKNLKKIMAMCLAVIMMISCIPAVYAADVANATIEPDAKRHEEYMFYFEKYKQLYALAKDWMHSVTTHVTNK